MALFISNVWKAQLKQLRNCPAAICTSVSWHPALAGVPIKSRRGVTIELLTVANDVCISCYLFGGYIYYAPPPFVLEVYLFTADLPHKKISTWILDGLPVPPFFFLRSFHSSANRSWGLFHRTPCPEELRTTHKSSPRYILIQATKAKIGDANMCKPHTKHHISPHPHTNETLWDTSTQHPTVVSLFSICSLWV